MSGWNNFLMKYFHNIQSSLIKEVAYDKETRELWIYFHKQDWQEDCVHANVPEVALFELLEARSTGKFYLDNIKPVFKIKNHTTMAKRSDKILNCRIDVTKINKDWLFKGEQGIYLDVTIFYSEEPHPEYKTNGMVTQSVPKKIYQSNKEIRGAILGNVKDFAAQTPVPQEALPGKESGVMAGDNPIQEWTDDLPF